MSTKILSFICIVMIVACNTNKKDDHSAHQQEETIKEIYTCSMHPEIIREKPGTCPICGMQLVRKEADVQKIVNVKLEDLLKPTDEFVISSISTITIQHREEEIEIEALGSIAYDTKQVAAISARVSGRIEKLYVRYRYQHVEKGQKIMDIYSPEIMTAQQNLIFLLTNDSENSTLISAAKEKLLLLGMSNEQLQQVINSKKALLTITVYSNYNGHIHEAGNAAMNARQSTMKDLSLLTEELPLKEGMYVQKGQTIFTLFNPSKAWAVLNIYAENQALVKPGNAVRIIPEAMPGKNFRATIDLIEPFYRKDSKTLTVRVYFDNSKLDIPIGSQVKAIIFGNTKDAYWLPKDAVVSLGLDKVAFIKVDGGFQAHKIKTGITYKNQMQVISGLNSTEPVAANAQYLMDSESFIKINH